MNGFEQEVDRRRFLRTFSQGMGVAAVVPGALACSVAHGGGQRWQMRLSASTIMFSRLPIEQACARIAGLGFEAVDVWSAHAGCPHLDDVLNRLGADGLKEVLARNHLKLYSFSVYRGGYPRYAELLGRLGGGVAVRGSTAAAKPQELSARMKQFLEALKPELELAEKYNSYLAIENHGGALLNELDSLKAFVELNNNTRLGIALAPYHLQAAKQSVTEAIALAGRQLFYFYAWQNAPGMGQLPGWGPTDCTPWISALAQIDYPWYVSPFMHHEPEPDAMANGLRRSCDYLQQCYQKAFPETAASAER